MSYKKLLFGCLVAGWGWMISSQGIVQQAHATQKLSRSGSLLMFKEKFEQRYHNGKLKVRGQIAQICELKGQVRRYTCPAGAKQMHVRHGVWRWWWPNGKLMAERHYVMGILTGVARAWFINGSLRWEEHYQQGKLHGVRAAWYASGKRKRLEHYEHGILHGWQSRWWWNGKLLSKGEFQHGLRVGVWKTWYINGDLKESVSYLKGKRHGVYTLWRSVCQPTGCASVKAVEGSYKDGKEDGVWRLWHFDANGQMKMTTQRWKNGQRMD